MTPIHLSDHELDIVMHAAKPLTPAGREAFLQDVATALASCNGDDVGPGTIFKICRAVQKKYFDPPLATDPGRPSGLGKYR